MSQHREITRTSYDSEGKHRVMTKTNYVSASVALLAALLAASLLALGLPDVAFPQENNKPQGVPSDEQVGIQQAFEEKVITSDGPLTSIAIGNDLACQVDHEGNGAGGEFWSGTTSTLDPTATACSTLLAVGDTTFGRFFDSQFTPVSQSEVVGRGTERSPFKVTTVIDAGDTGLRITQTDSYVVGNNFYTTKITVKNRGTSRQDVVLYKYGDCFLNGMDANTRGKVVQSNLGDAPACESTNPNAPEVLSFLPRSGGFTYQAGDLDATFAAPQNHIPYGNTCDGCTVVPEVDSGVGLSWELSIGRGDSKTKTLRTKVVIPSP